MKNMHKIPALGVKYTQLSSSQKMKKNTWKFFSFIANVVETTDKHSFAIISANFWAKNETIPMAYSGARGTLIYEKTWSRKSRVRLPLKIIQ